MSDATRIRYTLTPWKVALWSAIVGVLFSVLYALLPTLRFVRLPGADPIPLHYPLLVFPAVAIAWASTGLALRKRDGHTYWCVFSMLLALVSVAFTAIAAWFESSGPG